MGVVLPPGEKTPEIHEFPKTLPIGFSARMVSSGLETELVVPAKLPQVVKEFVQGMRQ